MNIICCRSAGTSAISHIYIYTHIYISISFNRNIQKLSHSRAALEKEN